jgi:hypothetical protein
VKISGLKIIIPALTIIIHFKIVFGSEDVESYFRTGNELQRLREYDRAISADWNCLYESR